MTCALPPAQRFRAPRRYAIQVRGPVETFGEYLVFSQPLSRSRFLTTEFPESAIKFGSKSAATRFVNSHAHNLEGVHAVAISVGPLLAEEMRLQREEERRMVGL